MGKPISFPVPKNPGNGKSVAASNSILWNCVYCMAGIKPACKEYYAAEKKCQIVAIGQKYYSIIRGKSDKSKEVIANENQRIVQE